MTATAHPRCRHCGAPAMTGQTLCAACAAIQALLADEPPSLAADIQALLSNDLAAIIADQIENLREKDETIARLQHQVTRLRRENDTLSEQLTAASNAHLHERAYARGLERQIEGLRRQVLALTGQAPLPTRNGGLLATIRRLMGRR